MGLFSKYHRLSTGLAVGGGRELACEEVSSGAGSVRLYSDVRLQNGDSPFVFRLIVVKTINVFRCDPHRLDCFQSVWSAWF